MPPLGALYKGVLTRGYVFDVSLNGPDLIPSLQPVVEVAGACTPTQGGGRRRECLQAGSGLQRVVPASLQEHGNCGVLSAAATCCCLQFPHELQVAVGGLMRRTALSDPATGDTFAIEPPIQYNDFTCRHDTDEATVHRLVNTRVIPP